MNTKCCLCKNAKMRLIFSKVRDSKKHKIFQCSNCNHIQIYPLPKREEDEIFYEQNLQDKNIGFYGGIKENRKKSLEDTKRRVELVKKLISKNAKILEIGSGHGFFLEAMHNQGYNITGIEVSSEKRKLARKITKAKILDVNLYDSSIDDEFDLIIMFHVLEHLVDPVCFLRKIHTMLKQNGKLLVEVPNVEDYQLKINEKYRQFYWQRGHIHYFSPKTLMKVIAKSGFKADIFGVQRYSIENMFHWKLLGKPQLDNPTYNMTDKYQWLDLYYKKNLEKSLKCDTIIAICKKKTHLKKEIVFSNALV